MTDKHRAEYGGNFSRRGWLKSLMGLGLAGATVRPTESSAASAKSDESTVVDIGSRRELFVDDLLVDELRGGAERRLHHPQPQEIALVHDAPWEGSGSGYHSVFQDGSLYRLYYKAWQLEVGGGSLRTDAHPLYCCYAESEDGIHWKKPELGLVEFNGSKRNNIVLASGPIGKTRADAGHIAVFKDTNPDCAPAAQYKAIVRSQGPKGLLAFGSPDGLRWSPLADEPIITQGAFDSQNLAFWDPTIGKYRAYWRIFSQGVRAIRTATSPDFLHWSEPADLTYADSPREHLYTNQVKPYPRAPHMLIGFPTRYIDRGWSESMRALPELEHRQLRAGVNRRYGTALTEGLFMSSRDGVHFQRFNEAFLRPGIERDGTWHYGQQYIAWHTVQTASPLPGAPDELSLYAGESYWTPPGSALRRYTLRMDGFVSVSAPLAGGELITRPLRFEGSKLELNVSTSAAGSVRVEIQDAFGKPLPGWSLADCPPMFGDALDREVVWKGGANLGELSGRPVRLRFELRDADLYAFQLT